MILEIEIYKAFSEINLELETLNEYFANVKLDWESCDCSEYPCSHPDYVANVIITNDVRSTEIQIEDGETLFGQGYASYFAIPIKSTLYDFYRACQLIDYELELTDYSKQIIKREIR